MTNSPPILNPSDTVLITGSNGFIGSRVVKVLLAYGFTNLRCLVRPSSNVAPLQQALSGHNGAHIEIVTGNLQSRDDCRRITENISVLYHLAAGRGEKSYPDAYMNTVITTRNLLDGVLQCKIFKRFVLVSSFAVYTNWHIPRNGLLDESCELEGHPHLRGEAYCYAKVRQEEIVAQYGRQFHIPYVIVRPGAVYGPGNKGLTGRVGIGTFGVFLHLGGPNIIPLSYVDNCAEAIVLAGLQKGVDREIFNIVDDDLPTSREFLRMYKQNVAGFKQIYLPHALSYFLSYLWELYSQWSQGQLPPTFNRKKWSNYWKGNTYSNAKLKTLLGWEPRVAFAEAAKRYFDYQKGGGNTPMIKVGIIGCGKIADAHAEQIQRIENAEIVAVCDQEQLMAKQLYERFNIKSYFNNVGEFLKTARPDVVHITTPPQSHFELGNACLEAGCHVYMEKPFTVDAKETGKLIGLAVEKKLKLTVGTDYQFTSAKRRMRKLIQDGYLGGPPVHMESYHCYELGAESYAKALLGDKSHWVRRLPGKLLHNNISHGICSIAEFLTDDNPQVIAHGFSSPFLKKINEAQIIDEARVIISSQDCATAYFTFSSQMRPALHQFRIYGPRNGLIVDHDQQTCIKVSGARHKSYLEKFVQPVLFSQEYAANAAHNIKLFLQRDFHMKSGMKHLIESFYRCVAEDAPPPIPYREIILTSKIMDSIFAQLPTDA